MNSKSDCHKSGVADESRCRIFLELWLLRPTNTQRVILKQLYPSRAMSNGRLNVRKFPSLELSPYWTLEGRRAAS